MNDPLDGLLQPVHVWDIRVTRYYNDGSWGVRLAGPGASGDYDTEGYTLPDLLRQVGDDIMEVIK